MKGLRYERVVSVHANNSFLRPQDEIIAAFLMLWQFVLEQEFCADTTTIIQGWRRNSVNVHAPRRMLYIPEPL